MAKFQIAVQLEERLAEVASLTEDEQTLDDVDLMVRYQQTLAQAVRQSTGRAPSVVDEATSINTNRPYRGADRVEPTPKVPTEDLR